jgi:hypothetical protein
MVACSATAGGASTGAPTATVAETPTASGLVGYPINVYFSNDPGSMTSVTAVNRVSPTSQVEEFAIQMLIAGPTSEERASGLFSELNDAFNGGSNCAGARPVGGPDFTLSLNMKGTTPSPGTVTLKFCRATTLAGEGTGFRIGAEIDATLMQFSNVKKVVILDINGNCWSGTDLRGGNACLQ